MGRKEKNGAEIQETNYSFPYMRKTEHKSCWDNLALGIWNADESKFLGRTKKMWGIVITFYMLFYAVLAGLIAICMYGLMATINEKTPKYILGSSIIGTNPGMTFRPLSDDENEPTLVSYNPKNKIETRRWSENIDEFLKDYNDNKIMVKSGTEHVICNYTKYPEPGEVCAVDMSQFGSCTSNNQYAYQKSSPCFFIKLNKIYAWVPEYYNDTKNLPEEMPVDLKNHIASLTEEERNQVWVSCRGESAKDSAAMGSVKYAPGKGLPGYYYPYTNTPGYLSPLISVQFVGPTKNRTVNIECRAWARNIAYDKSLKDAMGYVRFQFKIAQNS